MADVASRDSNDVPTLLGVSSSDGTTVVKVYADPVTHRLLVDSASGGGDVSGPGSSTDDALVRWDGVTGTLVSNSTITLTDAGVLAPTVSDAGTIGSTTKMWSDIFLAAGANIDWDNGDIVLTSAFNALIVSGALNFRPSTNDGSALGEATVNWSDLFLASGAVIDFNNGDVTITHSANALTFAGGTINLGVATASTLAATTSISLEETGAGTDTITLQAPASIASSYTLTLPVDDGTSGQLLSTNGSGVLSWITDTSRAQLPTIVVAAAGGDYTTIQAAVDAAAASHTNGALIYLTDEAYTLVAPITYKSNGVQIIGNASGTTISVDCAVVPIVVTSNADTYQRNGLSRIAFSQTNVTPQGVGFRAENMSLGIYDDLKFINFGTAIRLDATADNTFYNSFTNIKIFDCTNGFSIAGSNAVNDNYFANIRIAPLAGGGGTGVAIARGQSNNFYNLNVEPSAAAGITGISLTTANCFDNTFIGIYLEANATNINIGAGVIRTTFIGGQVVSASVSNLVDSGTGTEFFGTDVGSAVLNKFSPFTAVDTTSGAAIVGYFTNNTSFAHTGTALVSMELKNASDTSPLLLLTNAGSGNYITASTNFKVTKAGAVSSSAGFLPFTNDTGALGSATLAFADLFLASGALVNIANGNWVATHSSGILTVTTGEFRITSANVGTNADSVPTLSSTSTLTSKTLTSPTIQTLPVLATGTNLKFTVPTADTTGTGIITNEFNSGYSSTAIGELVYLDSSATWQKADADASAATYSSLLGIALSVTASGAAATVLLEGFVYAASQFPTFTIGAPVYMSATAAAVTNTAPVTTDSATRIIGYGVHADKLWFKPDNSWITHT